MAVIEGGVSGELAGVGAQAASPQHVVLTPWSYGALGHYRIAMVSGTMAAALGANSEIFQFRYTGGAVCLVHRVHFSAGLNVAATAAGLFAVRLAAARGWTADGSGGTAATLTGNSQKLRTSMGTTAVGTIRCATTAALGAGTKTLDAQDMAAIATGIGTGAITTTPDLSLIEREEMLVSDASHPIALVNQEGFVIRTGPVAPAAMTWHFAVQVYWAEVAAY
jgi:hypothetical protein